LDDCRETWRIKEEKAAKDSVKTGRCGLFVDLSGRISTGSTISAPRTHKATDLTTFYHFVPHLSRKSFIVKQKLAGVRPTWALPEENAKACGESDQ
jgi:hypothetical protein